MFSNSFSRKLSWNFSRCLFSFGLVLIGPLAFAGSPVGSINTTFNTAINTSPQLNDSLIVKYRNPTGLTTLALPKDKISALGIRLGQSLKLSHNTFNGAHVVKTSQLHTHSELEALAAKIMQDPNVEYAEPNIILHPMMTPNDSRYNEQWHYYDPIGGLNLPPTWDIATGAGVVVAVIDTGYTDHQDLLANILPGYDLISDPFTAQDGDGRDPDAHDSGRLPQNVVKCGNTNSSWHGTHVAGTIAALTNNNTGVAGVAFDAKILPVRVMGCNGGSLADTADAIIWAAGLPLTGTSIPINPNPAKVINLSLGAKVDPKINPIACSNTMQAAIDRAVAAGSTIVVAAGNKTTNAQNVTPASCNNVISVAATNKQGDLAFYSNYGSIIDIAAPGGGRSGGVLSTMNTGTTTPLTDTYQYYEGTSMAAPHIAGLSALLYQINPGILPSEVETIIKSSARPLTTPCTLGCGAGIADAFAAVQLAGGAVTGNLLQNAVPVTNLSAAQGDELHFQIDVPVDAISLTFAITGTGNSIGDADLYVRFGARPNVNNWDNRPYQNGNNETVNIANLQAGTYFVMLRGYTSFSGVQLLAKFKRTSDTTVDTILENGITKTGLSAARNGRLQFEINIPANTTNLTFDMRGANPREDADISVRFGAIPTATSWDYRPYLTGSNETVRVTNPRAGMYYVIIEGYTAFSNVQLTARY